MVELLKQGVSKPLVMEKQVSILYAGVNGFIDDIEPSNVVKFEIEFHQFMENKYSNILNNIKDKNKIDDEIQKELENAIEEFKTIFNAN
jgi:F-type H+-transporting ATPase subunit alpha